MAKVQPKTSTQVRGLLKLALAFSACILILEHSGEICIATSCDFLVDSGELSARGEDIGWPFAAVAAAGDGDATAGDAEADRALIVAGKGRVSFTVAAIDRRGDTCVGWARREAGRGRDA
mmetsp:Transcript_112381/g.357179  ORF Transcript_112381/g.357179 Transcript_112381/m.357179 type:complete len:120 (+) Transcript_112381:1813-2172(+)